MSNVKIRYDTRKFIFQMDWYWYMYLLWCIQSQKSVLKVFRKAMIDALISALIGLIAKPSVKLHKLDIYIHQYRSRKLIEIWWGTDDQKPSIWVRTICLHKIHSNLYWKNERRETVETSFSFALLSLKLRNWNQLVNF